MSDYLRGYADGRDHANESQGRTQTDSRAALAELVSLMRPFYPGCAAGWQQEWAAAWERARAVIDGQLIEGWTDGNGVVRTGVLPDEPAYDGVTTHPEFGAGAIREGLPETPHNSVKPVEHRWVHCDHCERETVICGGCGNNCCNGGHGVEVGPEPGTTIPCRACPSAYRLQARVKGPVIPATPQDIRDFIGSTFDTMTYSRDDHEPDADDRYTLSAHDLLGAFSEWFDR